jgi:hypothetical protein
MTHLKVLYQHFPGLWKTIRAASLLRFEAGTLPHMKDYKKKKTWCYSLHWISYTYICSDNGRTAKVPMFTVVVCFFTSEMDTICSTCKTGAVYRCSCLDMKWEKMTLTVLSHFSVCVLFISQNDWGGSWSSISPLVGYLKIYRIPKWSDVLIPGNNIFRWHSMYTGMKMSVTLSFVLLQVDHPFLWLVKVGQDQFMLPLTHPMFS